MRRLMAMLAIGTLVLAACSDGVPAAVSTTTTTTTDQAATTTVAPTTTTEAPTTTTTFPPRFESSDLFSFATTEPVITNGPNREWDWQFTDPGGATHHDGSIHVLQNGFVGWPAPVGVGYWRSDDVGKTWIEVSGDPVFDGTSLDYVGRAALASSVLVEDDGTWTMYFYTWDSSAWPAGESKIGRATAPAPIGPWTADAQPVLVAGSEGSWDEFAVRSRTDSSEVRPGRFR